MTCSGLEGGGLNTLGTPSCSLSLSCTAAWNTQHWKSSQVGPLEQNYTQDSQLAKPSRAEPAETARERRLTSMFQLCCSNVLRHWSIDSNPVRSCNHGRESMLLEFRKECTRVGGQEGGWWWWWGWGVFCNLAVRVIWFATVCWIHTSKTAMASVQPMEPIRAYFSFCPVIAALDTNVGSFQVLNIYQILE